MAEIRLLGWCFKAVRVCMQLKSCRETKTLRARTGEKRPPRRFGTHLFQRQKWMNNKQIVEKRSERGRGLKQLSSHRQSRRRSLQPTPGRQGPSGTYRRCLASFLPDPALLLLTVSPVCILVFRQGTLHVWLLRFLQRKKYTSGSNFQSKSSR